MITSIFIFRRDLRLIDNIALENALRGSDRVVCLFIFDPRQISSKNDYKSDSALIFMINSLLELDTALKDRSSMLVTLYGDPAKEVRRAIKAFNASRVYINRDYTPFAEARDEAIESICKANEVSLHAFHDCLLLGDLIDNKQGSTYLKFTPFYDRTKRMRIATPSMYRGGSFMRSSTIRSRIDYYSIKDFMPNNADLTPVITGGRSEAFGLLKSAKYDQKNYDDDSDYLTHTTTLLSAHNKFGTVSIREVYSYFKDINKDLVQQLFWRDFYYNIMSSDPNALDSAFDDKYNKIRWSTSKANFDRWKRGTTGVPIVDACMRELNAINYMHNRGRMIVASFLVKNLLINWRWGEQYFAQQLVDYDPAQNFYNWQWVSGTGPFSAPYFRVFNPWEQSKKYDQDAEYIKYWVEELADVDPIDIHKWYDAYIDYDVDYPKPMVDTDTTKEDYIDKIKSLY